MTRGEGGTRDVQCGQKCKRKIVFIEYYSTTIQLNTIEQEYGEKDSGEGEPDEKDRRVGRQ